MLTLVAAVLRFYKLGEVPPGFQFDEAFNAIDASQVLDGNRPLFLPANGGREVLYTYFQAAIGVFLGLSVYTLRLASALWGIAAVPATYLLLRTILRRNSRLIAASTALALAISYWHIHFSHYGIRVITMPVIFCALFGSYWIATHAQRRNQRLLAFVLAGLFTGVSVYSNPTGRFVPFVLLVYTLILLWRHPHQRTWRLDSALGGLFVSGAVALLVFLPLGVTFYKHPDFFFGHAAEVSVFASRVSGERNPLLLLGENVLRVLGMFSFVGDSDWTHGMAGRPVLDWAISIPFMIGVVVWIGRLFGWRRTNTAEGMAPPGDPDVDALALLALWAVTMLAPSVLSEAAPNYSRTLPALPAALLPIGLGLTWIVIRPWPRRWIGPALAGAIIAASTAITVYDYFVRFPQMREVYYVYEVDKADALAILKERGREQIVYFSPLWAEHPPVRYFRGGSNIKTLNTADTLVLPAIGMGAAYAFTAEERDRAEQLARLWPNADIEHFVDRYDEPLLSLVEIDAATAGDWPTGYAPQTPIEARFDDGPTLLGMQASPAGAINLFWRAEASTYRDLTAFIHLIDADGARVAQVDRLPGDGSYITPAWSPGERVIDRAYPQLIDPCAGGDTVRAVVGWYQYIADGARRPRLDAAGDSALAGEMRLPVYPLFDQSAASAEPLAKIRPFQVLNVDVHERAGLQPGAPFVADITLRSERDLVATPASVTLNNGDQSLVLWQGELAPGPGVDDGDVFCQRVRGRIPMTLTATSTATIMLSATDPQGRTASGEIGVVEIQPSQRNMTQPAASTPISATLAGEVRLVGANVTRSGPELAVELIWQALTFPSQRASVFVQVLDANGQLVAQSDAVPAGGYPLNRWAPGEYVVDRRLLAIDPGLAPGNYTVVAGMYDDLSLQRLPAIDAVGDSISSGAVEVAPLQLP